MLLVLPTLGATPTSPSAPTAQKEGMGCMHTEGVPEVPPQVPPASEWHPLVLQDPPQQVDEVPVLHAACVNRLGSTFPTSVYIGGICTVLCAIDR